MQVKSGLYTSHDDGLVGGETIEDPKECFPTCPTTSCWILRPPRPTPHHDRITEIASIRFEYGMETERWQTLINPASAFPLS